MRNFRPDGPSPLQWLALYLFRGMRDDIRGLIAVILLVSAFFLFIAFHRPFFDVLCALMAFIGGALLEVNHRNNKRREEMERE